MGSTTALTGSPSNKTPQFLVRSQAGSTSQSRIYTNWTAMSVTRSLEQVANSFTLQLTNKWSDTGKTIPLKRGDPVTIHYAGVNSDKDVITGWIDMDSLHYTKDSRTIGLQGRSLTGDLVDCSAFSKAGQKNSWAKTTLANIAADICKPFGISSYIGQASITSVQLPFPFFQIIPGETCFQALERACRMRGCIMTTDGTGALVFQQVGTVKVQTVLKWGDNILSCDAQDSFADRYSQYTVQAQASGGGLLGNTGYGQALSSSAVATDNSVANSGLFKKTGTPRYRPLLISTETGEVGTALQTRAYWECATRAGKGRRITYTVDGWEHSQGLWDPNTLVHVSDPENQLEDDLLIVTVTSMRSNDAGTTTQLELASPLGFQPQPLPLQQAQPKGLLGTW